MSISMNLYAVKHVKILSTLTISLMLLSCGLGDDDVGDLESIESPVHVLVAESHAQIGPPSVVVHFETDTFIPCINVEIAMDFSVSGEMIVSDLEGLIDPPVCEQGDGPATSTNFTEIQEGEYLLEVSYDGDTDLYNIGITEDSISIDPEQQSFTENPFEVAWRFPENSFAYLCGTTGGETELCDGFTEILNDMNLEEITFPDRGFKPYPESTTGFGYDAPALYYSYESQEALDDVLQSLIDYDQEVNAFTSGLVIFLVTWEFDQYVIGQ